MKIYPALSALLLVAITGCANLKIGSDFQSGRNALLRGNTEAALPYFQSVVEKDPNYSYGTAYRLGVLGYLGRTQYSVGQLPEARTTLERALSVDRNDDAARLYLGLTLAKSGDRQRSVTEIETGMKGIHEFLEWVTQAHRFTYGQFWDPNRSIRNSIEGDLAMLRSNEIDWPKIIANGEWLGKEIDEEIDRARQDEIRERSRENDGGTDSQP